MKLQRSLTVLSAFLLLVLGSLGAMGAQPYEPTDTTVGLWHMDEFMPPWDDSSGNDLHLTVRGSVMSLPGLFGNAMGGITPDSYVFVNDRGALAGQTFTIEAWISYVPADFEQGIANRRWPGNTWVLGVAPGGVPYLLWWDAAGVSDNLRSSITVTPNRWYHVAAVVETVDETTTVKLYVTAEGETSAVLAAEKESSVVLFDNPDSWFFVGNDGHRHNERYFRGLIDEVRLSNVALEPEMLTTVR